MHSEFPNVHWETKVAKNDLQDLQKSFNHSSSTIFIKFGFHFWRKCLLACLKVFFPFARWGQIQTTITVCDSRFGGFFFFFAFMIFVQDKSHAPFWQYKICWFVLVVFYWYIGFLHFKWGPGSFTGLFYLMSKSR